MLKLFKKKMPMPVTVNDCLLLWQMGYTVQIHDGKVKNIKKMKKGEKFYDTCFSKKN